VREDYSENGNAWEYFPYEHALSRAYRWGEDGILGICDNHQRLCFALSLWNGADPTIKERFFGLTGPQGNHGEDVKERYFFLDNTPSHAYLKGLYKYPRREFPYRRLVEENRRRGLLETEFELADTGIFENAEYFDVTVEYAKQSSKDILIRISVVFRGQGSANLHVLPTVWFRNTWVWGRAPEKPHLKMAPPIEGASVITASHAHLGTYQLFCENPDDLLFTENETNFRKLFETPNQSRFVKDGINDLLVHGATDAVNPEHHGTKAAAHYRLELHSGQAREIRLRLRCDDVPPVRPFDDFSQVFATRIAEADEFHAQLLPTATPEERGIHRQALAGLLWSKQYYRFALDEWLEGDPAYPPPRRRQARNRDWIHLDVDDVLSMPDTWEFPWFAAWDLAFHAIPLAQIDPDFAKRQLGRLTREWYMHPNGQIPAYEWVFSDVNPPVHAWATWRVYRIEAERYGRADRYFLERVFMKLLLNFTWWVNRKDSNGDNVFQGGFLGLDNIGIFDRSKQLPTGGCLEQSDGTSWMGMYCLNMLEIALELARENPAYEDIASKFFEHFLFIADAMSHIGKSDTHMWDERDGFFYDVLHTPHDERHQLKVRSMVGIIPLFAVSVLPRGTLQRFAGFRRRYEWFLENRPHLSGAVASLTRTGECDSRLLAIVSPRKLRRILSYVLDEDEFLSPFGIRSLSRFHEKHPFVFNADGVEHRVGYEPGESQSGMFGGNSNWRGPVWFPMNYLIIESLRKFHSYLGDDFTVECPTRSGRFLNLAQVADEIARRLVSLFLPDQDGRRAFGGQGGSAPRQPGESELLLFHEYFHADTGCGLGANHQTGWTALVATLIESIRA
jgi:hypothetical protein